MRERYHKEKHATPGTLRTQRQVFGILDRLGMRKCADLADETLDRRFDAYTAERGWAYSTRDMLRGHFHAIARSAYESGLLPCQPTLACRIKAGGRQWKLKHPPSSRTIPPHPDLVRRLLDYFAGRTDTRTGFRTYAFFATIAMTRLTLRSAIQLRKENILLGKGDPLAPGDVDLWPTPRLWFRPRRGKQRHVPAPAELVPIMDEWLPKNGSPWWVFPGVSKHRPWCLRSRHGVTPASELKAACRVLGIEPSLTWQQLRGSLASPRSVTIGKAPPPNISPPASAPHSERSEDLLAPEPVAEQPKLAAKAQTENSDTCTLSANSIATIPSETNAPPPAAVALCRETIGDDLKSIDPLRTPEAIRRASEAPASLDPRRTREQMLSAGRTAIQCGAAAEEYKFSNESGNSATSCMWFNMFVDRAVRLNKFFAQDFSSLPTGCVPRAAIVEFKQLALMWTATRDESGVGELGVKSGTLNEADWSAVLEHVDPLGPGCAEQYFWLCDTAFRLLSALGEKDDPTTSRGQQSTATPRR
jgi:integrase